jgi:hypothetical protein
VAAGEQGDRHTLEQMVLAYDYLLDLEQHPLHGRSIFRLNIVRHFAIASLIYLSK